MTPTGSGYLGALSYGLSDSTGRGGVLGWTFAVRDADLDFLGQGETRVQTYTIAIDDGHGGIDSRTVSITITGALDNTPPVVAGDSYSVDEDTTLTVTRPRAYWPTIPMARTMR